MSSEPRSSLTLEEAAPDLWQAWSAFQRVAYPGTVDIVTRELVRILSGQLTRCSICRNTRVRAAVNRGLDETMVAALAETALDGTGLGVGDGAVLSERHQAAVRFARAFLVDPAAFSPAQRAELQRHFTPEQIAELVLDLVRYRPGSKMTVAAGHEPASEHLVLI